MKRPNILFLMADDHASAACGCYNSRLSPFIWTPHIAPEDWRDAMYYHHRREKQPAERPSHYGIRTRRYKLIYYYGMVRAGLRDPEECWELYDLQKDPYELRNRYGDPDYTGVIPHLREELEELRQKCDDTSEPFSRSSEG